MRHPRIYLEYTNNYQSMLTSTVYGLLLWFQNVIAPLPLDRLTGSLPREDAPEFEFSASEIDQQSDRRASRLEIVDHLREFVIRQ